MEAAPKHFNCSVSCNNCSISQLCIPFSLNENELNKLDDIIQRKRPFQKGDKLFEAGKPFKSLYAVRSGSFKSYTISNQGDEQITAFHLPGDIIGFDGINTKVHPSFSVALETAMVCEIPFETMDELSSSMPKLRQQVMRLMSNEITTDQELMLLLNRKTAEQKLAAFISALSYRFNERGFSSKEFRLTMTRSEIGNYLGLTVETISRLLSRFQKSDLIEVNGKFITIVNLKGLDEVSGSRNNILD
ncbi:fumarate/nitrate reduction transcriptional regulator Fnr [Catenovulum maritimum]|uniref:Transcriptional regulator n=1 Tax=Catenovulum maritimum TaxID=1513271 RepID=A0A0J8GYV6_9ALTE|nr:fumarate/nitrate reduction transcriptional regulator Fnr [Catenovulum maritimum]KMT66424.1 transcriptional regulator [Catenovulum maritimum]